MNKEDKKYFKKLPTMTEKEKEVRLKEVKKIREFAQSFLDKTVTKKRVAESYHIIKKIEKEEADREGDPLWITIIKKFFYTIGFWRGVLKTFFKFLFSPKK